MSKRNKKHQEHEEHADESWLLPYSDLMTLLLAMFIVLFGMSNLDAQKFQDMSEAFRSVLSGGSGVLDGQSLGSTTNNAISDSEIPKTSTDGLMRQKKQLMQQEQENLEALKKELDNYIEDNGLTEQLDTKLNQSQLMITISDKALFPSGEADVKPDARILAKAISTLLQEFPDYEVIVSGHTDNVPISTAKFPSNWDLSSARALNFMKILILNEKLDPMKFSAIGYGEYHPVTTNDTNVGRAQNRRVEVSIIRKYQDGDQQIGLPATQE